MSVGFKCVCYPMDSQSRLPDDFLAILNRLDVSPMFSSGKKIEYRMNVFDSEGIGGRTEVFGNRGAIEKMLEESLRLTFHNADDSNDRGVIRCQSATYPGAGRFAETYTCSRIEKDPFLAKLAGLDILFAEYCAAFAQAVGARTFSFTSTEKAIEFANGIVATARSQGRHPIMFANLPDEPTECFLALAAKEKERPVHYKQIETSIGTVYCLAFAEDGPNGETRFIT